MNKKKKGCVLCRNFISIYKINRTLHGRLGIRILSSLAESISHSFASLTRERYFQHSKIEFVFPRGHVVSSIYNDKKRRSRLTFSFKGVVRNRTVDSKTFVCEKRDRAVT